jgi:hypothetical protein
MSSTAYPTLQRFPAEQACMGGWCAKRGHCQHFHARDRSEPSERLCVPGADGVGMDRPIVIRMPAGSWEPIAHKTRDQEETL